MLKKTKTIKPKKLLLLDSNEYSLYSILNELETLQNHEGLEIIPILTSVQDKTKISISDLLRSFICFNSSFLIFPNTTLLYSHSI